MNEFQCEFQETLVMGLEKAHSIYYFDLPKIIGDDQSQGATSLSFKTQLRNIRETSEAQMLKITLRLFKTAHVYFIH